MNRRDEEDLRQRRRLLVNLFSFATAMPNVWVAFMAKLSINAFFMGWAIAAPLVWFAATAYALKSIQGGHGERAKYIAQIPALWAMVWLVAHGGG
ncbi:MAG: hypothetical protein HQL36_11970 [Alphaproteobacteria bacterium]|nr:hypothetical protein [Alphaproteobacteria bacterium]